MLDVACQFMTWSRRNMGLMKSCWQVWLKGFKKFFSIPWWLKSGHYSCMIADQKSKQSEFSSHGRSDNKLIREQHLLQWVKINTWGRLLSDMDMTPDKVREILKIAQEPRFRWKHLSVRKMIAIWVTLSNVIENPVGIIQLVLFFVSSWMKTLTNRENVVLRLLVWMMGENAGPWKVCW